MIIDTQKDKGEDNMHTVDNKAKKMKSISFEIGLGLVQLAEEQNGLDAFIRNIREELKTKEHVELPLVHVYDNTALQHNGIHILINGETVRIEELQNPNEIASLTSVLEETVRAYMN